MATVDLKKVYREHYSARVGKPALVEVPPRPYLMIDGEGDPNVAQSYRDAVAALYAVAYRIRADVKAATGDGYTVMPLEGLWWADDMSRFTVADKAGWKWTMMICLPPVATSAIVADVLTRVTTGTGNAAGERVRVETFGDGPAAQVMHLGPYADEAPTIEMLHAFIAEQGLALSGIHHEIYLGDPRKGDPAKLKTIIRQPVASA